MPGSVAKSNCWTCKERKVGCDRALPGCANCSRAKRECKGYGLKLAWPDKYDGRRKQKEYQADPDVSATNYATRLGEFCFLNTGIEDIEAKRYVLTDLILTDDPNVICCAPERVPPSLNFWKINMANRESILMSYYESVVARMITRIDDSTNGFRLELVPMALTSTDASATSLLESLLALASFHMGSSGEALEHKVRAYKALSASIHSETPPSQRSRLTQFASCMMFCVYSIFDASDTSWNIHLEGARTIAQNCHAMLTHEHRCNTFLKEWYVYHHIFSEYTHSAQFHSSSPSIQDILVPESFTYNRKIVGLSGCSTELLQLISCINQLRTLMAMNRQASETDMMTLAAHLRMRLFSLQQEINIRTDETTGNISRKSIHLNAELYRIATVIYLYNTYPDVALPQSTSESPQNLPRSFPGVPTLVHQAFMILDQMDVCTSPWPLFEVACNVTDDRDRIEIMRRFEEGARVLKIGNYNIIAGLVKAVWKRQDLSVDEGRDSSARIADWRELVDEKMGMPSFI